jgi:hypothetical protein
MLYTLAISVSTELSTGRSVARTATKVCIHRETDTMIWDRIYLGKKPYESRLGYGKRAYDDGICQRAQTRS